MKTRSKGYCSLIAGRRNKSEQWSGEEIVVNTNGLSVVIPVFNEEKSVLRTIDQVREELKREGVPYEIIVVNDCSTDATETLLTDLAGIRLMCHTHNCGYGAAIKSGVSSACYGQVLIVDADGSYPINEMGQLTRHMNDHDMVVAARVGHRVAVPLARRPAKWVIARLANFLSGMTIPDLNSGFRVMKKEMIQKYIRILPDGFSFTTTITLALLTNGHKVCFVPIDYFPREGKSKIRPIPDTLNFVQLIIRTTLYFNPLKIFIPFCLSLICTAFLILITSWWLFGKAMDVTFGILIMTAVMVLSVGMIADLIDKKL